MSKIFMTLALIGCGLTWLGAAKSAHNQEDLRARRLVIEDKEGRATSPWELMIKAMRL